MNFRGLRRRCVAFAAALMAFSAAAFAGRPLIVDDAQPVEHGQFELEVGVGHVGNDSVHHYDFPVGLTYGVLPRLEIGVGFGGQIEERGDFALERDIETDMGDLVFGAKWKVFDQDRFLADHAVAVGLKLPTADDEKGMGTGQTDFDITWIMSRQVTEKVGAHANVGYTWTGDGDERIDNIVHFGVALDYLLTETIQPVIEIAAQRPVGGESAMGYGVNGGVRWTVREGLTLDAAIGTRVHGDWPDLTATVGLTWGW